MACCDRCGRDDCCGAEMQEQIKDLKEKLEDLEAELYEANNQAFSS